MKEFVSLLCVIDVSSKHAWVVPLKDKKGIAINNCFQKGLDKSGHKPDFWYIELWQWALQ